MGTDKENLLTNLEQTGYIYSVEEVDVLVEVRYYSFTDIAATTFDVSDIAEVGDTVVILHYNEVTKEWEYIGKETVDENGTVTGDFTSHSPVASVVIKEDETINSQYGLAPVTAINNWNYTLDEANKIVTLNYYTGAETNVIVYAYYQKDNIIYKTQLASNKEDATEYTPYMFNYYRTTTGLSGGTKVNSNISNITSIKFDSKLDTSKVTNMKRMFNWCLSLTTLDISNFDTSNVTDMGYMFGGCSGLTTLNLSNFNTSNATDMRYMFSGCSGLTTLNLSNFDTSNITKMSYMFYDCSTLKTIYVTNGKWITSQSKITSMFFGCGCSSVIYK